MKIIKATGKNFAPENSIALRRDEIHKILIIKMRYIGDTVLMTPLVNAFKEGLPHAQVDVIVNQDTASVLSDHPFIDKILEFNYKTAKSNFAYILEFLRSIRKQHYDLVIDITGNDRAAFFTFMTGAKLRIGYDSKKFLRRKLFYTHVVQSKFGSVHTVDHHLSVAEFLKFPVKDRHPSIWISAERLRHMQEKLYIEGLKPGEAYAVIHPGARRWYKSWPSECFAKLADRIIQTYGIRLVLVGSAVDQNACASILDKMQETALNLAGRISLGELPALIAESVCLIGNDSAPIHIATAVKTPTVALFGPTKWECWYPRRKHDRVIAAEYPCRPCGHSKSNCPLGDGFCMSSISFESVWEAVNKILGSRAD
ncbi:MAG: putative lipopolysaccharide heptosyltransferase III [Desulfobacterales bacterium]|nr:putative lipopolysaccharide heptosyltransferase III [Desulfobacterales bacterium]